MTFCTKNRSQSLNIHMTGVTTGKLSSMHFHGWQRGLKTGMYYLRTKAAADAIKFTQEAVKAGQEYAFCFSLSMNCSFFLPSPASPNSFHCFVLLCNTG